LLLLSVWLTVVVSVVNMLNTTRQVCVSAREITGRLVLWNLVTFGCDTLLQLCYSL
jgi:hypothetical protein